MRLALAALAASLALAAAAYLPSIDGQFQFDDWTSLQTNWRLRDPAAYLAGLSPADLLGPARPLPDLVWSLHLATTGLTTWPFHVSSLAFHLAAAALAFVYLRRLLAAAGHPRAAPLAVVAASLFALHPLQTESVSYVAQLSEVISSGLALAALLLLHRADAAAAPGARWGQALAAALVLLLALGAKTVAVTVPAVALLASLVLGGAAPGTPGPPPAGRRALRTLVTSLPAWAVSAAAVVKVLLALQTEDSAGLQAGVGPWRYLLSQCRAVFLYLRLLVAPVGQNVSHTFAPSPGLADPATLAGVAGVVALLAAALLLWRRAERAGAASSPSAGAALPARVAAFGTLWWFLLLSPTSSVVPIVDLVAEHRVYLALLGPALALVVAVDAALAARAVRPRWGVAAAAVACLALAGATAARAAVWHGPVSLWQDSAAKSPADPRVAGNLAYALAEAQRIPEARAEFRRAMALPSTPRQLADNARNFSAMEAGAGDNATALSITDLGIAADPWDYELRINRAVILHDLLRPREGLEDARLAVRLAPGQPGSHHALAACLLATGQPAEALAAARTALRIDPSHQAARRLEFLALAALGDRAAGCDAWQRLRADGPALRALAPHAARLGCR